MATLSEADVWHAADELVKAEENPTIERIRARLGGGSQTTIVRHLKTWRAERDGPQRLELPDVPGDVAEAFRACWVQAAQEARVWAEGQYQEARDAVAREHEEVQRAIKQARAAEKQAQHDLDVLNERIAHVDEARAAAEQRATDLEQALANSLGEREKERTQALERERVLVAERNALMESVAGVRKTLADALRRHRADERKHQRALTSEKSRYEADTAYWMNELDKERQTHRGTEKALEAALSRCQQAEADAAKHQDARELVEADSQRLRNRLAMAEESAREFGRQLNAERDRHRTEVQERMGSFAEAHRSIETMLRELRNVQQQQADNDSSADDTNV
jgi:chromosome segregation ATPase